ncbi:uncharacterized protein F4807DRAFT_420402 [Annulohypoxylon truncatum]|uniref:uncharacterized protein n=1 Tax=Annulohypoxylon truncatum TaxID=327061 RepID=UPI00200735CE|nr:uncharacterized protein F4807DRAFT_420402 [Annulohypoxylon truncatum]KAI1211445.1 hypothetical protein F4807DRAFT_420402 [Annulohypoxylon truncatum]
MPIPVIGPIFKKLLAPELDNNGEPNAFHFMLGQEGYRFQSRVFRIPSRFGAFSRGPRQLQAYEGSQFALLLVQMLLWITYGLPSLAISNFLGVSHLDLGYVTFQVISAMVTSYWLGMLFDPHRRPENFHEVWRPDGWRQTDLEDRLEQAKFRARVLHLRLERNELQWDKLQLERSDWLELRRQIEEEGLESDEDDMEVDMIDAVELFVGDWSSYWYFL